MTKELLVFQVDPPLQESELSTLFAAAWPDGAKSNYCRVLSHSLAYVSALHQGRLIGFVNVAWDGGIHGFVLDTTVHPEFQRRGIGTTLVQKAAQVAKERGVIWLHVDFEPELEPFYWGCGFQPAAAAGLMNLRVDIVI